jgi:hypothetical protein
MSGLSRKRRITGEVQWVRVPYDEGVANRVGPESCGGTSNGTAEALTGARAGQVLSREILLETRVPTRWDTRKATPDMSLSREMSGPCAVLDLGTYGSTLSGNREILCSPSGGFEGRIGKSEDVIQ